MKSNPLLRRNDQVNSLISCKVDCDDIENSPKLLSRRIALLPRKMGGWREGEGNSHNNEEGKRNQC